MKRSRSGDGRAHKKQKHNAAENYKQRDRPPDPPPQALLKVHPRSKFNCGPAVLRKPMFLGDFSLDSQRHFCHDKRNLQHITVDWQDSKKVEFDLNVAMDKVKRKNYEETKNEKLDRLLEWILSNTAKFHNRESAGRSLECLSTDFVCFRGLLTQLLCTPYEDREGWIICATRFRNTIYLCAYETPEKVAQRENETPLQKKMSSWGYKFEQYMSDGSDPSERVDENEEYCCVLRSRLGEHSLVYGAEVDGADPSRYRMPHSDLKAFIELKTSKELTSERDYRMLHRFKFAKWWSQSYLVGIPRVVCGFRDQEGTVHTLRMYQVQDMPHSAKDYWKSDIMLNFLSSFFEFVKQNVQVDDPKSVYKFERSAGGDIACTFLGQDPDWTFIPQWYHEKVFES